MISLSFSMATFAFLMDKQYKRANLKKEGLKFYYFKPSLFFEMSLKFFAHFNSCYDFDLSDVSQKSQS